MNETRELISLRTQHYFTVVYLWNGQALQKSNSFSYQVKDFPSQVLNRCLGTEKQNPQNFTSVCTVCPLPYIFLIACFNQLIEWMMNNITKRNFAFCTWLLTIHCTLCSVEWKRERIEFVVAHFKTIKATGSLSYRQRGALVADFIPTPQFPLLHSVNLMCTLAFLTSTLMLSGRPKKSKFSVEERVLF